MKKVALGFLLLGVIAISGCSGSSSSGSSVNLTGVWTINPHSLSRSISFNSFRVTLQQSGSMIAATSVQANPSPGTTACSNGSGTISGTVSGSVFNGQLITNASTTTFSVSGTSSSMSGTFSTNIHSGPCKGAGIVTGNLTMARI